MNFKESKDNSVAEYPSGYYKCSGIKDSAVLTYYVHYLKVIDGDDWWIGYNEPGSSNGRLNVNKIVHDTQDKTEVNWNRTYANIILHEVFYHGIAKYRDYFLFIPPTDSLGNREGLLTRDIGILPKEAENI